MRSFFFYLIVITALLPFSCLRYSFSGSTLPAHIKTVTIPIPDNASSQPGIDETLRDLMDRAFTNNNQLRVVPNGGDSELLMNILSYRNDPDEYDASGNVKTYRVSISVAVRFLDVKENKALFENTLTGVGVYSLAAETEAQGRENAIRKIGDMIINNTISGW